MYVCSVSEDYTQATDLTKEQINFRLSSFTLPRATASITEKAIVSSGVWISRISLCGPVSSMSPSSSTFSHALSSDGGRRDR